MSKSKYGNSNLYMTTREFADMVIDILDEQNYFKKGDTAHPGDICIAFSTVAETIGKTMEWAIKHEHRASKPEPALLEKNEPLIRSNKNFDNYIDHYSEWKASAEKEDC